jgi:hypothetical protein
LLQLIGVLVRVITLLGWIYFEPAVIFLFNPRYASRLWRIYIPDHPAKGCLHKTHHLFSIVGERAQARESQLTIASPVTWAEAGSVAQASPGKHEYSQDIYFKLFMRIFMP